MPTFVSDFRHAVRTLLRARAFTAVCVVSLGLGMGVVIAILLLLRMVFGIPPGVDPKGLAEVVIRPSGQLRAQAGAGIIDTWSYPDYLDVGGAARGMVLTGWSRGDGLYQPSAQDPAIPLSTMYVSSNYFATLGVTLARGRGFTPADDATHAEPEAVIGYRAWQARFAADPDIVGRAITINQTSYVVIGVALMPDPDVRKRQKLHVPDAEAIYHQLAEEKYADRSYSSVSKHFRRIHLHSPRRRSPSSENCHRREDTHSHSESSWIMRFETVQ